jgi:hypothetical protein
LAISTAVLFVIKFARLSYIPEPIHFRLKKPGFVVLVPSFSLKLHTKSGVKYELGECFVIEVYHIDREVYL